MRRGIDVSSNQTLAQVIHEIETTEVDFGFVKASQGSHYRNPLMHDQIKAFASRGIPVGLYHFYDDTTGPLSQFRNFENQIREYRGRVVICVDDEEVNGKLAPRADIVAFVNEARVYGYKSIGRYASLSTFQLGSVGADWRWVAFWEPKPPPIKWSFWQQSGTGKIDVDQFHAVTQVELHHFWRVNAKIQEVPL